MFDSVPRRRILGQAMHLVGQLALDAVGEGDRLENLALRRTHGHPDLLEPRSGALVVEILRTGPRHLRQGAVHCADHVGEGDVRSLPRQRPAALGATASLDQIGAAQIGEDRPEVTGRNALSPGDLVGGARSPVRHCDLQRSTQRVVGSPGKSHGDHTRGMPRIEYVTVANHAESVNGLLYLQGAGLTDILQPIDSSGQPGVVHVGIGISMIVGWNETNHTYPLTINVEHEDGEAIVTIDAQVETGRPVGLAPGSDQRSVMAVSGEVQFQRTGAYRVRARLESQETSVTFRVHRPSAGPMSGPAGPSDFTIPPLG